MQSRDGETMPHGKDGRDVKRRKDLKQAVQKELDTTKQKLDSTTSQLENLGTQQIE